MLHIAAVLIYLGVAALVYRGIQKKLTQTTLPKRAYFATLLRGALPCTVCIAIFELLFDRFILKPGGTLGEEILTSFFRAALIEEGFKYISCRRALKILKPATKTEYMLLCGMVGAGYGLVEKLVFGGGIILIVNAVLPLHIFFQFLMGAFLYEAQTAGDERTRKRKLLLAYCMPFLVHGSWDSMLDVSGALMESEAGFGGELAGLLLMFALIGGGIFAEVRVVKKMGAMAGAGESLQ